MEFPSNVYATTGDRPDEVNLQWDSVKGASKYVVQKSIDSVKRHWKFVDIVIESNCTVVGLKPKRKYIFRVAAINGKGQSEWSTEISKKL